MFGSTLDHVLTLRRQTIEEGGYATAPAVLLCCAPAQVHFD